MSQDFALVDWEKFQTAYGSARKLPVLLAQLGGVDHQVAMEASHEIWCSLCHQHAYVSSAAFPALPLILKVLDTANNELTVEILDILLGFISCDTDGSSSPPWIEELHLLVARERGRFHALKSLENENVASFAELILEKLDQRDEMKA